MIFSSVTRVAWKTVTGTTLSNKFRPKNYFFLWDQVFLFGIVPYIFQLFHLYFLFYFNNRKKVNLVILCPFKSSNIWFFFSYFFAISEIIWQISITIAVNYSFEGNIFFSYISLLRSHICTFFSIICKLWIFCFYFKKNYIFWNFLTSIFFGFILFCNIWNCLVDFNSYSHGFFF